MVNSGAFLVNSDDLFTSCFRPPPGGFLQATLAGEQVLAELTLLALHGARRVADLFCGAAWSRPQACLSPTFRSCWSSLTSVSLRSVEDGLRRLAKDLETGEFRRRYPDLQRRQEMDLGIRILTLLPRT